MSQKRSLFALAGVVLVATAAFAAAIPGALAQTAGNTAGNTGDAGNAGLAIGVSQGAQTVTVSVTNASTGDPVENATVNVSSSDANVSYNASGVTDAMGTVSLAPPNETVNATIVASANGSSGERVVTLHARNGTGPGFLPLGQQISAYVDGLKHGDSPMRGLGLLVADFVTGNTGPPAHAGPPADAGPADADDEAERGPPADAGPPDDIGPFVEGDEDDDEESEDNGGGPPSDAGPPDHAGGPPR